MQSQFVAKRVVRVKHTLIKFRYGNNAYADAIMGKLFKTTDNGAVAMKGVNNPVGIREIAHNDLDFLLMPAARQPRFVDVPYQFTRVVCALPATGGRSQRF